MLFSPDQVKTEYIFKLPFMQLFEAKVRYMQKLIETVRVKNKSVFSKLKIKFIQHDKIQLF